MRLDHPSFEVLEIRASGAYATVCRVRKAGDPLGREVAVKALRAKLVDNARALMRTRDEARLLARLNHPNIVRVEELLSIQRRPCLVMEWVPGASLRELLDRHRGGLPLWVVLEVVAQAAFALDAAWSADGDNGQPLHIVHRDVKPGNLLLSVHGVVKLVDFGLSRGEYFERETTTVTTVLGSMGYMAPERFDIGMGSQPGIDIYALGLVMVELLTGKLPLLARDPELHDPAVRAIVDGLPLVLPDGLAVDVRQLMYEMCRFDHEKRPSYAALRRRIGEIQAGLSMDSELASFATDHVEPMVSARTIADPRGSSKWSEVAFLEDPVDGPDRGAGPAVTAAADADRRVRAFLGQRDWAARKRELKWLLALHPDWTAAPFMEVLQRTTRPWWVFWVQPASAEEVAVALELLRHRPTDEARDYVEQLVSHSDPRVSSAAEVLLSLILS